MIWSVLTGGRSTVTCWFCHAQTQLPRSTADADTSDDWLCYRCDNRNARDAHGNLVDAWPDMYQETAHSPRAGSRVHGRPDDSAAFCASCQRNQELVRQILAVYLPDEDDPDYQSRFDQADEYAQALRRRYPLVCRQCQLRVNERLQQQAQWMQRRELGSALRRSDSARSQPARVLPSLRRRRAVLAWCVCAAVGLAVCVLAAWAWYVHLLVSSQPLVAPAAAAGLGIALLTSMLRMLNPLWLYAARHPGVRAGGLAVYRRRVARLALLRALAAVTQATVSYQPMWSAALLCDVALCVHAAWSVHICDGRRPPSRQSKPGDSRGSHLADAQPDSDSESTVLATDRTAEVALSSLKSLSFGASEANMDQDDSMLGAGLGAALPDPWQRRPSAPARPRRRRTFYADSGDEDDEDENTIDAGILPGLGTLSFGARREPVAAAASSSVDDELAALLGGGGGSNGAGDMFKRPAAGSARPSLAPRRPFEAYAFNPNRATGLESRMSAFSIDDDGSDQGLFGGPAIDSRLLAAFGRLAAPRTIAALCTLASWVGAPHIPALLLWLPRLLLLGVVCAALSTTPRSAARRRRRMWGGAVLAGLVCMPVWVSMRHVEPPGAALARWSQARQLASWHLHRLAFDRSDASTERAWPPLSIQLDCAAELAGFAFLALC